MTRRAFLKSSVATMLVLSVAPDWVFAKREEPMITLPDLIKRPHQDAPLGGWYEVTVICTHKLDEFDEVGRVVTVMCLNPRDLGDTFNNYAVCDGRKIPLKGHEELGRLLMVHRYGVQG